MRKKLKQFFQRTKASSKDKAKGKGGASEEHSQESIGKPLCLPIGKAAGEEEYKLALISMPPCLSVGKPCYMGQPPIILDPKLRLRFPEKRETISLHAGFNQTPILKKISSYYAESKPNCEDIVSDLSPLDLYMHVDTRLNTLRDAYSKIAPVVVSVSCFEGVERKIDCSGLVLDWDSRFCVATVVTSAKLIWSSGISTAEVHLVVRMHDGRLLLVSEEYVDYYHNLLILMVKSTIQLDVVDLGSWKAAESDMVDKMNVIALGHCFYTCSLSDHSGQLYKEHPFFGCGELFRSTCQVPEICEGGPLITDTGFVVGINFYDDLACYHPLPAANILTCLKMWSCYGTVFRPSFGMSVVDVDRLPYQTWEKSNISLEESSVVVKEVYKGSLADKYDVRSCDSIATLDAVAIRSAKQLLTLMSEKSQEVTVCDFIQESFKMVVKACDGRRDDISIEANFLSVDDKSFYDCWPQIAVDEWYRQKVGSQKNPRFNWPPKPESF